MKRLFRHGKRFGMVAMAILLSGALLLGSVVPAKAAEERIVKIAFHASFTGVASTTAVPVFYGHDDHVTYVNEHGGINGVKLDLIWEDTRSIVPRSMIVHKRYKEAGAVMEFHTYSSQAELMAPLAASDEIPMACIVLFTERMITKPLQWMFGGSTGMKSEIATFMHWVKDNWAEARPPRIGGFFLSDVSSALDALEGAAEYATKIGVTWVGHEAVPMVGTVDSSTEWLRTIANKPDWVYCAATSGATGVVIIKDAARLGVQKKGIKLCAYLGSPTLAHIRIVGKDAEEWYGIGTIPSIAEVDLPGMKALFEAAQKYRGWAPKEIPADYTCGWINVGVGIEAIRLLVDKVGFEGVTPRAIRDTLANMEVDNGLTPPATMSDDKPYYCQQFRVYQVQQGIRVPYSEWMKPPFHTVEIAE